MSARTLCLSILYDCEATGYEIRKLSTEGEYSYFAEVSYGAIYPALAKLAAEELISMRVEAQDGKPSKKVYSINESGRAAFLENLLSPVALDSHRSEFLLLAHFANQVPRALMLQRIEERATSLRESLKGLEKIGEKHDNPADKWVVNYGCTCISTSLHYLESNKEALIELAKADDENDIHSASPLVAAE